MIFRAPASTRPSRSRVFAVGFIVVMTLGLSAWADTSDPAVEAEVDLSGWKPYQGGHYRLDDGQLACYSEDGRTCSINVPDKAKSRPLRCDRLPRGGPGLTDAGYQGNGHRRPDHWCNWVYAGAFAKWMDHTVVGYPQYLSTTPRGDVMCLSMDGVTCMPADQVRLPLNEQTPVNPLVCGRPMLKRFGFSGYEPEHAKHWCQSPELMLHRGRSSITHHMAGVEPNGWTDAISLPNWAAGDEVTWLVRVQPQLLDYGFEVLATHAPFKLTIDNGLSIPFRSPSAADDEDAWRDVWQYRPPTVPDGNGEAWLFPTIGPHSASDGSGPSEQSSKEEPQKIAVDIRRPLGRFTMITVLGPDGIRRYLSGGWDSVAADPKHLVHFDARPLHRPVPGARYPTLFISAGWGFKGGNTFIAPLAQAVMFRRRPPPPAP